MILLCPTYSFFATAGSITRLGATPVFVDIDPTTYNICPDSLARAFERPDVDRIKAIIPVHLFGQCADMDAVTAIATEHSIPVIEDSAQAIGSEDIHGRRAGSMGIASAFSFFPSKNLGGFGDGGIVTTNDSAMSDHVAKLRNHGMEPNINRQCRRRSVDHGVLRMSVKPLAFAGLRLAHETWPLVEPKSCWRSRAT